MTSLEIFPEQHEPSPGRVLADRRVQLGLSIDQVAKQLYMTVSKVEALETDNYSYLNSDTFIRGYIRAYANLLQLDVVALLEEYDALIEARTPKVVVEDAVVPEESSTKVTGFFVVVIAVFFLFVWLIDKWFFDSRTEPALVESRAANVSLQDTSVSLSAGESRLAVNSLSESTEKTASPVSESETKTGVQAASSQPAVAEQGASSVTATDSVSVPAVPTQEKLEVTPGSKVLDEISFQFTAECWLEVSDSRGDVLATELQPAGSSLKLVGRAPFDVKVGNAPAVKIAINGKKFEVIPLLGTNVLTLKVNRIKE